MTVGALSPAETRDRRCAPSSAVQETSSHTELPHLHALQCAQGHSGKFSEAGSTGKSLASHWPIAGLVVTALEPGSLFSARLPGRRPAPSAHPRPSFAGARGRSGSGARVGRVKPSRSAWRARGHVAPLISRMRDLRVVLGAIEASHAPFLPRVDTWHARQLTRYVVAILQCEPATSGVPRPSLEKLVTCKR